MRRSRVVQMEKNRSLHWAQLRRSCRGRVGWRIVAVGSANVVVVGLVEGRYRNAYPRRQPHGCKALVYVVPVDRREGCRVAESQNRKGRNVPRGGRFRSRRMCASLLAPRFGRLCASVGAAAVRSRFVGMAGEGKAAYAVRCAVDGPPSPSSTPGCAALVALLSRCASGRRRRARAGGALVVCRPPACPHNRAAVWVRVVVVSIVGFCSPGQRSLRLCHSSS